MFKTDTNKATEGGMLKPEGDYEVVILKAETTTTPNGKEKIAFRYVIRNDIDQKFKNGLIFDDIWKKREPNEDDLSVDGFNFGQLMALARAARLPNEKEYESLGTFLAELVGKPIKVHLYHDDYNDKYYEKVDMRFPTDFPDVKHVQKTSAPPASGYAAPPAVDFAAYTAAGSASSDDDYPF